MTNSLICLVLALVLCGCAVNTPAVVTPDPVVSDYYNRADIDAINAEAQCKAMARNLVQIARCGVRR